MDEAQTRTGQGSRRTASRLRHESGFTLIEVLVAALVMSVGVAATMRVFGASGHTTLRAQAQQVAVQQAQGELERIATLPYPELALTASAASSSDPQNPGFRVSGASFTVRAGFSEPLVMTPGPGATAGVEPGPEQFAVGTGEATITGKIYRYVSWRDEDCPLSLCEGGENTKRVTVATTIDATSTTNPRPPVWVSTIVADPATAPPGSQAPPSGGPSGGDPITAQSFYLYDTPCGHGSRQPQSGGHATRDTASTGAAAEENSTCGNPDPARQPDLMGNSAPPGDPSTPVYEYSSDLAADYLGGLAPLDAGSSCVRSYPSADASDPARPSKWSVHAWSTGALPHLFHLDGQVTVSLFTATVGGASGSGRLCATLVDRDVSEGVPSDRVLGAAVYDVASWPRTLRRVTFSFQLAQGEDVSAGHRLMLALHVHGDTTQAVWFLYDHPMYPSLLEVATSTPL
jgi:prepilin-type N-terminal cleavage/methylation domain-containing protein